MLYFSETTQGLCKAYWAWTPRHLVKTITWNGRLSEHVTADPQGFLTQTGPLRASHKISHLNFSQPRKSRPQPLPPPIPGSSGSPEKVSLTCQQILCFLAMSFQWSVPRGLNAPCQSPLQVLIRGFPVLLWISSQPRVRGHPIRRGLQPGRDQGGTEMWAWRCVQMLRASFCSRTGSHTQPFPHPEAGDSDECSRQEDGWRLHHHTHLSRRQSSNKLKVSGPSRVLPN